MEKYKWVMITINERFRVPENYDKEQCSTHMIESLYKDGGWPGVEVELLENQEQWEKEYQERRQERLRHELRIPKGIPKPKLTAKDVKEYQDRVKTLKDNGKFTGNNFKSLGMELRDKFNLTDMQALDILNNRNDEVMKILIDQED